MRGFTQQIPVSPLDQRLASHPIVVSVPVSTTRIINFFNEFLGMASSIQVLNRDGTNAITIILNNDRINSFTIPASASITFDSQWMEQIEIVSGAAGVTVVMAQLVNAKDIGLSGI